MPITTKVGYEVTRSGSYGRGHAAVETVRNGYIDLVLIGVQMPEVDRPQAPHHRGVYRVVRTEDRDYLEIGIKMT